MTDHSAMRLGRQAPRRDQRTLRMASYMPAMLPEPPVAADWCSKVTSWPMAANDRLGDCTCAAASHLLQAWSTYAGAPTVLPDADVIAAYEGASGYNPADPSTDQGAVELDVLTYWWRQGIGGHKVDAFASVNPANLAEVKSALAWFGGLYIGLALPLSAQAQDVWDTASGPTGQAGSWGGHAVCVQAYDADGLTCITWGQAKRMTWAFWRAYCDEAYACLSHDFLTAAGASPDGLDWSALQADLAVLQ